MFLVTSCAAIRSVNLDTLLIVDPLGGCDPTATPLGAGDGSSDTPYLICSNTHLSNVHLDLTKNYKLMMDLDLTAFVFEPIGADDTTGFSGVFDGNSKTISNWTYANAAEAFAVAFVRRLEATGEVKDLTLDTPQLTGNNLVAGIAGISLGNIHDITVNRGTFNGKASVGGIVAESTGAAILDDVNVLSSTIYSDGTGTRNFAQGGGADTGTGGIVGGHGSSVAITDCNATNVTVTWDPAGPSNVQNWTYSAGIAGYVFGGGVSNCTSSGTVTGHFAVGGIVGTSAAAITDSYSSATVTGHTLVGGIVGWSAGGGVTRTYASGDVTGVSGGVSVGGIVGVFSAGTLSESFSTGNVTGDTRMGNIVGDASAGIISDCYGTGRVVGHSSDIGGSFGLLWGATLTNIYSISTSVTSTGAGIPYGMAGRNAWAPVPVNSYYYSAPVPADIWGTTPLSVVQIMNSASYVGFDFTVGTGKWRMPSNITIHARTPVLAWACGKFGIVCF